MGPWGRVPFPCQQEPSPQEMSHSPVGAAATSAFAAGASGGEQVPETTLHACARLPPHAWRASCQRGLCAHAHTYVYPTHAGCAPGLWGEPSSQTVECPVWEPWFSLLLTELGAEGTKQEGAGFRPQGPPTSCRAVGSLLEGLYPREPGPPRLRR